MVVHHQAFGHALAFVVTRSHADRIELTAVALAPRMRVMDWRGPTREMEDAIDFEQDRLDDMWRINSKLRPPSDG